MSITVTEKAAKEIQRLLSGQADTLAMLRIRVVGGGCSGLSYKLEFDSNIGPTDTVNESNSVKIVVDSKSTLYLNGVEIDFSDGLNGTGFSFANPSSKKSCGCGSSFSV